MRNLLVMLLAHTVMTGEVPPGYTFSPDECTDSDELAEIAGRSCYRSYNRPNPETRTNRAYLARSIIAQGHFSVLEHASATFYIQGCSRDFTHQLIRHRHFSYSELSFRFWRADAARLSEHPTMEIAEDQTPDTMRQEVLYHALDTYKATVAYLEKHGITGKAAREAARGILPGGIETAIIVTGNIRAWREMIEKRYSPHADAEFQAIAQALLQGLKSVAPNSLQGLDI